MSILRKTNKTFYVRNGFFLVFYGGYVTGRDISCHGIIWKTKWRSTDGIDMGPKKQAKVSKWQPLPENVSTMQVMSVYGFDDHSVRPEDLPNEELENCIKFIEQSNKTLEVENTVIEKYLLRMDPATLFRMDQVLEAAAAAMLKVEKSYMAPGFSTMSLSTGRLDDVEAYLQKRSGIVKSMSQSGKISLIMSVDKGTRVQPAQKIEIVNREIEELRNALDEFRQKAKHSNYILRCKNEELSSRLREINESRSYFEEKLLVENLDPLTGKLPGEKFIRYLEVKLVSEESEIDKIRMKTSSTKNQLKRLEVQLAQKAELGEILYAIDFDQLKIENQQCQERLDEKVIHLLNIKKMNGHCGTVLNFNLKKLQEQLNRMSDLQKSIQDKEKMIEQLKLDEKKVNAEVQKAYKSVKKIKNLMNTYTVPDVFDYILEKAEMLDLKKEIKISDRKLRLRDLALATQSAKLKANIDPSLNFVRAKSSKKLGHI